MVSQVHICEFLLPDRRKVHYLEVFWHMLDNKRHLSDLAVFGVLLFGLMNFNLSFECLSLEKGGF